MSDFNYEKSFIINWFKALDKSWVKWPAKKVAFLFGYENQTKDFVKLINKSKNICKVKWVEVENHFFWDINDLNSYFLTKYSCYLISVFADLSKKNVTYSKTYFDLEVKNMYI